MRIVITVLLACFLLKSCAKPEPGKQVNITIENNKKGAPVTLGIPFPKGTLYSVDNLRLLTADGTEIPCQTTEVSNWGPIDESIKWVWVFFFSEEGSDYVLEYGDSVAPMLPKEKIISTNNMRPQGGIDVNTGPLSFSIHKRGNGFLDEVYLDSDQDGKFAENELIGSSKGENRGSFFDILDDAGIDASKAVINEVFREKGSGPMHSIFRIEGTYTYNRPDNNISPFSIWLHTYAGKSYIKVLHTMTYTGIPDKHKIQEGQHANIATQNKKILSEQTADDPGWTQPNDQIAGVGLQLKYHLDNNVSVSMPMYDGDWKDEDAKTVIEKVTVGGSETVQLLQKGPEGKKSPSLRSLYMSGFKKDEDQKEEELQPSFVATVDKAGDNVAQAQKAKGWINVSDGKRGVGVGIKNFLKEYPKGIELDASTSTLTGSIWPKENGPKSFARANTESDGEMLDNFAQGITKTTEFIYYFHDNDSPEGVGQKMDYVLDAPVAHASPEWYTGSKVYGNMAPFSEKHPEFENALQYKYQWWTYNQENEPWYGIFDYGDGKTYFFNGRWVMWTNNEPTTDFMLWTNFMRTGDPKFFNLAQAMSRHTMDVDNIHWPRKRTYYGEINDAIDFWNYEDEPESTPYLGIGRRHANEHWNALLSAHVWIQGWIADYYLAADHRALEVAKMTGDTYINRIWGEHDLRGRRLYLSVLNLVELYDATKLKKYKDELDDRVNIMLELQERQGGNLLLDRYGYSQTYVAQGLYKYQQITGDERVKKALVNHARWVRDVPPLNHEMESYLATIYPLLIGYEFSGEKVYLNEALARAEVLKIGELPKKPEEYENAVAYSDDLVKISNLPESKGRFTNWQTNQGLRVFGWTHAYNIPYLLYWLDQENID
ncbi:hypothetical protein SAMN04487891_104266 [Flagellimonas taeanensis]|uniref:Uncharacterized protein n=1 Tax=Flagellimonas taeanensis TaxID=1005926 RepID=A0A1M6WVL1_9FLAO|nr:hypothetical protein [Allomuricauda taeanensis]SFB99992.1 hypothetical protein SAMN04487891_104266 [Allomuricauda taeanensis]SHK97758.1 hypothetical protein SAMN05216293_2333 [Allomuricauda taeanensis]